MGIMMIAGTERRRQGCSLQDGKQWGINTGGAVRTSTLPIPFTNVFLAVASTSSEWCCPGCSATNTTVTTRAYQSNRPDVAQLNDVNWIIIGCQPQWGASGYAVTFPIAFNVVYNVLSIPQTTASTSNAYWGRFYITALNKNGFNVSDTGAGSNRWIAIGSAQPQWGYYVESQNPTDYRYWSIPFTSHYITMATKTYYEPKEEAVPWLVGIDMQKFICGYGANFIGSSYVSCVGIGCQPQWGLGSPSINFPIAFPKECFIAAITRAAGNYEHSIVITTKNKTNLSWICKGYDNSAGNTYANWLALGCQLQWGYSTVGSGAWALKFNGVYTAVVVGAPGFPAREFCGFTFDYTLTGWSFTAGYNSPVSYIRPTTTAISLGY